MSLSVTLEHKLQTFTLDVHFDAPDGITCLFGRSGSGKTTIVNAVAGLLTPQKGQISTSNRTLFDSEKGINLPPHKRRIGYIFQEARLFPHLTVAQNLAFGSWFAPRGVQTADKGAIVEMLGLQSLLARRPARLSGGEKQRVAIGRALLSDPSLILADEPLAALDDQRKQEILPYFEKLRDHVNVPILYVSHSAAEVSRLATTVVALEGGRVIKQDQAAAVLSDPRITPLGASAAGTFLKASVLHHHPDGITEVEAGGARLLLPAAEFPLGASVRVRVEAQDVMIALSAPQDISALNVLPAQVAKVRMGSGPGALVQLKVAENLLLARITRRSAEALGLREGKQVFAVLKAVSIPRGAIGDISGA